MPIVDHSLLMKLIRRCYPHPKLGAEKMVRELHAMSSVAIDAAPCVVC